MTLDEIKNIEFGLLKEFHKFCEENNLKYSLAYGTLLGAVRHRDFIPWDDDIDVYMLRKDYNKFLNLSKNNYSKNAEVLSYENTRDYIYPFAKIIDKGTSVKEPTIMKREIGVYIDVFPLDDIEVKRINLISRKMKFLSTLLKIMNIDWKQILNRIHKNKRILGIILHYFLAPILRLYGNRRLLKLIDKNIKKYSQKETEYVACYTGNIKKGIIKKENMEKLIKIKFREEFFYCINTYDEVLKNIYGDYWILPPIEKRKNHCMEVEKI